MANEVSSPESPADLTHWESLECAAADLANANFVHEVGLMTKPARSTTFKSFESRLGHARTLIGSRSKWCDKRLAKVREKSEPAKAWIPFCHDFCPTDLNQSLIVSC